VTHKISRREWLAVIAVILLAFALRVNDLHGTPPGLHIDELANLQMVETVTQGRVTIFFPENIGNEALYFYIAGPFMSLVGKSADTMRLVPVFMSMVGLCVIWALTRRLFGPVAALVAMAGFAATFWTLLTGRIMVRTVLELPLAALAAYCFWRARSASGRHVWIFFALSGLFAGLSIETYIASRALPVIFVAFGLYILVAHRSEWRFWFKGLAITLAMMALVALPLVLYLAQNSDGGKLSFFNINQPLLELSKGNLQPLIENVKNVLGMFIFTGDALPYYGIPGRPFLEPIGAALLIVGMLIAVWRWRKPEYTFLLLWFFLTLVPTMLSFPAPNSIRAIGAQVVVFMFIGISVAAIVRRWPNKFVYAGLFAVFAFNVVWTARDYFVVWPSLPETRFWQLAGLRGVADQVQRDPDTTAVAVCAPDQLIYEADRWWEPAWKVMRFLLHRPELAVRYYNCVDTLIMPEGASRYAFPDAIDDATLQQFPIYTKFLASAQPDRTELPDQLGMILKADPRAMLDQQLSIAAQSPVRFDGSNETAALPIDLGGKVEFLGYMLSQTGKDAELVTYWRATDQLPPQVSQFTHVLNDKGDIVTQQDRLMLTSQSLRPGDVFSQIHRLTLPKNLPPGSYPIAIGLYTQPDGKRLPIMVDQQPRGDRVFLRSLRVAP
jgi:4-amino-4-deoxy-L-arabinose transferase-like glycosyltransferase